jgi:hypothetical protein
MSTEGPSRRTRTRRRRLRLFLVGFGVAILALAVVGGAGAAISATQGPRVTDVQFDPAAAVATSGSRLIVTTNQSLQTVDPSQVEVTPAVPFTVDTSGRSIGIRFTLPLDDETDYAVRIADVSGAGTDRTATLTQTFRTPALSFYVLQRGKDGDTIFRTDLAGTAAVPVFQDAHIEDFRATSNHLVVSVRRDDAPQLVVTDRDGQEQRTIPLPGDGVVAQLQSADRGEIVGYTYSDRDAGGDESVLYSVSLADPAAEPAPVAPAGADARVAQWRFVPDTDRVLIVNFAGRLLLTDPQGQSTTDLGSALTLDGIGRGSSVAVVERVDGIVAIDLADGTETPLPDAQGVDGVLGVVMPLPGDAGETLRPYAVVDGGTAQGTTVYRVGADGAAQPVFSSAATSAFLETCVSPSGRYAAFLVAPRIVDNPYDTYLRPLPATLETHVVDLDSGQEVVALAGSDISWCQVSTQ